MTRKNQISYEEVLDRVATLAGSMLSVKNIVTDQELAEAGLQVQV